MCRSEQERTMTDRPDCIRHWREVEEHEEGHYQGDDEPMGFGAPLARHYGLTRLGIHHVRLPTGRRTSLPHAESTEEEFVYVLEGTPDVWLDGDLHRLAPGDSVGFPAGTGMSHTFINNCAQEAHLLVVGETARADNRILYPKNPERKPLRSDWWEDAPPRTMGSHDGLPDAIRTAKAARETRRDG
jgi:uncharacterized cupin superfamily protein